MAPIRKRPSIRSRAERSAKDPRGIYAPPLEPVDITFIEEHELQPASILTQREPCSNLEDLWRLNKKDKRTIKHNTLLTKVQDGGVQKSTKQKRRRPGNKLAAVDGLSGLADALPEVDGALDDTEDGWEGVGDGSGDEAATGIDLGNLRKVRRRKTVPNDITGKMVMKSAKSRPGAMKRRHKMEQSEIERFKRNLAQMASTPAANGVPVGPGDSSTSDHAAPRVEESSQANRWKALRAFIGGTMQQDDAFAGKT